MAKLPRRRRDRPVKHLPFPRERRFNKRSVLLVQLWPEDVTDVRAADLLRRLTEELQVGRDLFEQRVRPDLGLAARLLGRLQERGRGLSHHHLAYEGARVEAGHVDR